MTHAALWLIDFLAEMAWPLALHTTAVSLLLGLSLAIVAGCRTMAPIYRDFVMRLTVVTSLLLPCLSAGLAALSLPAGVGLSPDVLSLLTITAASDSAGASQQPTVSSLVLAIAMLIWLMGVAVMIIRTGFGLLMTARLVRSADPVGLGYIRRTAERLQRRFGVRAFALRVSDGTATPFVGGIVRPTVVLPREAEWWSGNRLRLVLIHELSHVRRRDTFWNLLGVVLVAINWFNPLVHMARRRLLLETELVSDDMVIASGGDSEYYAQYLLDELRTLRSRVAGPIPFGVGMARRSQMEERLMSVLTERTRTIATRGRWLLLLSLVMFALAAPVVLVYHAALAADSDTKADSAEQLPGRHDFVAVDKQPELTHMEQPVYPEKEKSAGITGRVYIQALVDKQGTVRKALVSRSSGNAQLDEAARTAALKNKFTPAEVDGKPVAIWVTYSVDFLLEDRPKDAKKQN
ncbi:TonB family protein [candidate division GN15 bacterium]|nr:TonB family protein [candidate division GN15 bacterium]